MRRVNFQPNWVQMYHKRQLTQDFRNQQNGAADSVPFHFLSGQLIRRRNQKSARLFSNIIARAIFKKIPKFFRMCM